LIVNDSDFPLIAERARAARVPADEALLRRCAGYLSLLARWNQRMNLTALPLTRPFAADSVDKLIIEPLTAAPLFRDEDRVWLDLGSGGGSPAIPLRLAHPHGSLQMIESRSRKCAFLREASRVLNLADTQVIEGRYESLATRHAVDLITIRAVRIDEALVALLAQLLRAGGRVMAFGGWNSTDSAFADVGCLALPDGSQLRVLKRR
jgi:16S rRNA (guanine527-N7)-methyltransferase